MRAPVDAVDDGVGRALQFVMQPALDQSAQHRLVGLVAMECEARDVGLATHAVIARCIVLMMSPWMPRSRRAGSRSGFKIHCAGPICSAKPSCW